MAFVEGRSSLGRLGLFVATALHKNSEIWRKLRKARTYFVRAFRKSRVFVQSPVHLLKKHWGNETAEIKAKKDNQSALDEPLMNEIEAARFLWTSRMTPLRKRSANEIGFFRVGFRFLYSKEKHLSPFLNNARSERLSTQNR